MPSKTYEMSMNLQQGLDDPAISIDRRNEIAKIGLSVINDHWAPGVDRLAWASSAYHIDRDLTEASPIFPFQKFGDIILRGTVPRIDAFQNEAGRLVISLPFFDPTVYGPTIELEADLIPLEFDLEGIDTVLPLKTRMDRPLYVPVESLQYVMFADG